MHLCALYQVKLFRSVATLVSKYRKELYEEILTLRTDIFDLSCSHYQVFCFHKKWEQERIQMQ
jgi:hypothetical protein